MSSSEKLVTGEGSGRIDLVEPTVPFVDDPNLTDKKYPENRTKSYRSREPVRIVAEVTERQAQAPEVLQHHDGPLPARERARRPALVGNRPIGASPSLNGITYASQKRRCRARSRSQT
ncbi:rifampin ADP-ribosyl transferase [mine drainage metagenome]|uniref:Rifampin ADP-ribosyl transferase n=1 Tax=mine drainage metagenome TaxID=410659 RepID=A0A1J5SLW7_9ZZZZ